MAMAEMLGLHLSLSDVSMWGGGALWLYMLI